MAATLTTASIATCGNRNLHTSENYEPSNKIKKLAFSTLVVASAATALVVQHQTQNTLRTTENQSLQQQIVQLKTDNANFSNQLANVSDSKKLTDDQFNELLKLRGEVGVLRRQASEAQEQMDAANQKSSSYRRKIGNRLVAAN